MMMMNSQFSLEDGKTYALWHLQGFDFIMQGRKNTLLSLPLSELKVQSSAKRLWPGLVNFVTAVAYHFCLSLPTAFTQPGRSPLAEPCIVFFYVCLRPLWG